MDSRIDMDKIARVLGGERKGKVHSTGGYFGALQLLAEIRSRFRAPAGGGRPTDPKWTKRRLVPLAPQTLKRLEAITAKVRAQGVDGVGDLLPVALAEVAAVEFEVALAPRLDERKRGFLRPAVFPAGERRLPRRRRGDVGVWRSSGDGVHGGGWCWWFGFGLTVVVVVW